MAGLMVICRQGAQLFYREKKRNLMPLASVRLEMDSEYIVVAVPGGGPCFIAILDGDEDEDWKDVLKMVRMIMQGFAADWAYEIEDLD